MEVKANFDLKVKFALKDLENMYRGGLQMSTSLKPGQEPLLMRINSEGGDTLSFLLDEIELKIGKSTPNGEYTLVDASGPMFAQGDLEPSPKLKKKVKKEV
jgi:hypothetical protein